MPSVKFSSLVKKSDITQKITSDLTLYVQHPLSPLLICSMCHVLCTACFVCNEVRLVAFIFEAHDIYISVFSENKEGSLPPLPHHTTTTMGVEKYCTAQLPHMWG